MAAISHLWRDESLTPPLTGIFLAVPSTCVVSALPEKYRQREVSWEQNRDAPIFNVATSDFNSSKSSPNMHISRVDAWQTW